jgi:hypothetical protein
VGIANVYVCLERFYDPPEGHPGQHSYTFVIRSLLKSLNSVSISLSAVTLGIYLGGLVDRQEKQLTQRFNETEG